jgi:TonB family protein
LSLLAHALLAASFRAIVYLQANPLDAHEVRLEFSVAAVRPRTTMPPPPARGSHSDSKQTATDAAPESPANSGHSDNDDEFLPVRQSGRGPRWIDGHITRADYPTDAAREGLEATVRALVYIRRDGSVYRVRILKGHPAFDATVRRKLAAAVFSPALDRESGRPVAVRMILPIEFRLK